MTVITSIKNEKLIKVATLLVILVFTAIILKFGKPFLVPLTIAALLAMLLLPVCAWLEKRGVNKAVATLLSIVLLMGFVALVVVFVSWQISDLVEDTKKLEQQVTTQYQKARDYISETLGIPPAKQKQIIKEQQASSTSKLGSMVTDVLSGLGTFLTSTLLVLVYIFLFIYFRAHLKRFIVRLVPRREEENARDIINRAQQVTQKYLTGLSLMIVGLWIMYGIGFTLVGVKNALFFAILCGMLEIVPFVGNLLGNALTIIMVLSQGGGTNMVIGVLITYGLVQFFQSYVLEPLVVGAEVNINPLFTIVGLVAGEMIWGIPGMILAIPLMGVVKIICDHIEPLQLYGQLIGSDKKKDSAFKKRIKSFTTAFKKRLSADT
ncbi:MAG TPA: AI-2E family transporter [Chryseolinea sp.]|nr:AI-2E family transporter [Chryseolinea sp.]